MVNVPMAVWIDEEGRIVRPAEYAGTNDAFRGQDRETGAWSDDSFQEMRRARLIYLDAIRDWAEHGAESEFAWNEADARTHLRLPSAETALANAHFRLGQHLRQHGQLDERGALPRGGEAAGAGQLEHLAAGLEPRGRAGERVLGARRRAGRATLQPARRHARHRIAEPVARVACGASEPCAAELTVYGDCDVRSRRIGCRKGIPEGGIT